MNSTYPSLKRKLKGVYYSSLVYSGLGADRYLRGVQFSPPKKRVEYPNEAKSAFCVSIDFDATKKEREKPNDQGTRLLINLSEKYGIPMTWAICGKTAEEQRSTYEAILRSKVEQEIAVHTYSHMDASTCSPEELESDISKCLSIIERTPKSFVFPWNREGNFEVLQKMGFIAYRGREKAIGAPRFEQDLWNIPPTYHADRSTYNSIVLVRKLLDIAINNNSVFHLWLHPWDLVPTENFQQDLSGGLLQPLLKHASDIRRRDGNALTFTTLGALAEHFSRTI
jgi:peptidoglycan/xylan/chitin deacetylase (PgdA/CDA1 family)